MRVSLKWLKTYVDISITPEELAERLTMVGFEVESVKYLGQQYKGFVVGEVIDVTKHPKGEKLTLCKVNVGAEILQIVCGAPNVTVGQKVPIGLIGAEVPRNQHDVEGNPFKLSHVKIRGVDSFGMICSEYELNLGDDKTGIMVLSAEAPVGMPIAQYLGLDDIVFEIGITPNRPDAMSHIGIAREIAAILDKPLHLPTVFLEESSKKIRDHAFIKIDDVENCPRYTARVIFNVKIGQSPEWMQKFLQAIDIRPVNNVVDVTNYILMECGQPLHAFDYDKITEHIIEVKCVAEGKKFTTLDHKSRVLRLDTLMICDKAQPIAIAGIMGGKSTEITAQTKNILLESAYFDPKSIRRSSKHFGLTTDASQRFERGTDPNITLWAVDRAAYLIREISGGEILKDAIDVYPNKIFPKEINLRVEKTNEILGLSLKKETICKLLMKFQIEEVKPSKENASVSSLTFRIPTFRPDLEREIDLIEEVARAYGYDNIEVKATSSIQFNDMNSSMEFIDELRTHTIGLGMMEVINNSMEDSTYSFTGAEKFVRIANPISKDMEILRTSLLPSLLKNIRYNIFHGNKNLRLFEIGRIYLHDFMSEGIYIQNYKEKDKLVLIYSGFAAPPSWDKKSQFFDIFDLKGEAQTLLQKISLDNIKFIPYSNTDALTEYGLTIEINDECIGTLGAISQDVRRRFDIDQEVFFIEFDVTQLEKNRRKIKRFKSLSKYPGVTRDIAIIVEDSLPMEQLVQEIQKAGNSLLRQIELFDIYVGDQIQKGKKSYAFALEFMAEDHTLTQDEIEKVMKNIINKVGENFQASIRQ